MSPRLHPLEPPFEPEIAEKLRRRMPRASTVPPLALFRLLVADDALSGAMEQMGRFNLNHEPGRYSSVEPRDREVVIERVCARCLCEYEWGVHVAAYAEPLGLSVEQVKAIASAPPEDQGALPERDQLLVRLVDQLHDRGDVDDALWAQLMEIWSTEQLLQMLVLTGWYHAISFVANAARLEREPWAARWPAPASTAQ